MLRDQVRAVDGGLIEKVKLDNDESRLEDFTGMHLISHIKGPWLILLIRLPSGILIRSAKTRSSKSSTVLKPIVLLSSLRAQEQKRDKQ